MQITTNWQSQDDHVTVIPISLQVCFFTDTGHKNQGASRWKGASGKKWRILNG